MRKSILSIPRVPSIGRKGDRGVYRGHIVHMSEIIIALLLLTAIFPQIFFPPA
jgi:hypothetical protein